MDLRHEKNARHRRGGDSLHASERRVMEMFEAGATRAQIEATTGFKRKTIETIISRLRVTAHDPWKRDAMIGSAALLSALRRVHPDRCGAAS